MANQEPFKITTGPSKEELVFALLLHRDGMTVRVTVAVEVVVRIAGAVCTSLTTAFPLILTVEVGDISVEGGSGNKWTLSLFDKDGRLGSGRLVAYYDIALREGWLLPVTS